MRTNRRLEFRPKKSQRRGRSLPLPLLSSPLVDNYGAHPRIHPRLRSRLARSVSVSILQPSRYSAPQWMKFFVINLVQERADRMRWRESAFDHPRSRWPWWSTRTLRLRRIDPFVLPVRRAAGGHQTHCVFTTIPISTSPPPQPLHRRRRPLRSRESFPFMLSSTSRPTDDNRFWTRDRGSE